MLYLTKSKGNNAEFKIMGEFKYLLNRQNHTGIVGDGGGGVL